jgi:hypothetical protein
MARLPLIDTNKYVPFDMFHEVPFWVNGVHHCWLMRLPVRYLEIKLEQICFSSIEFGFLVYSWRANSLSN